MAEEVTTIKVFTKDRRWLELMFGQPTHAAFHAVTQLCPHPEDKRTYTSALLSDAKDGVFNAKANTYQVHGFRCGACGRYIFADTRLE